jgi:hypothetical protein
MSTTLPEGLKWPQFKSQYSRVVGTTTNTAVSAAWEAYKDGSRTLKASSGAKVSAVREKKASVGRGKGKGKARAPSPKRSPVKAVSPKRSPTKAASPVKRSPVKATSPKKASPKPASPRKSPTTKAGSGQDLSPLKKSPPSTMKSPPGKAGTIKAPPGAKTVKGLPAHVKLVPSHETFHGAVESTKKGTSAFMREMESAHLFVPLEPLKVVELLGPGYAPANAGLLPYTRQWKFVDTQTGAEAYLVDWRQTARSGGQSTITPQELWTRGLGKGMKAVFLVYSPSRDLEDELMGALVQATGDGLDDREFMVKNALIMMLGGTRNLNNYSTMEVMALPLAEAERNLSTIREAMKLEYEAQEAKKGRKTAGRGATVEEFSEASSGVEDVD